MVPLVGEEAGEGGGGRGGGGGEGGGRGGGGSRGSGGRWEGEEREPGDGAGEGDERRGAGLVPALSKAWRLPPFAPPFTKLISPSSLPHLPISLPGFPSPLPPRPPVRPLQALSKAWRLPPFEQCDLRAGLTCDAQGMVTRINLANRNLTGVIPKAISAFASLTNLSLHDNHLYGHLPDMGRLKLLRELYLHGNNLKGAVPASLSLLSNLEALNLGENALSGGIPVELGNLKALILL
ncbi:unnamed protein product [Closterium sp. NIES-64]|nr:unnamed protein product [Closterium sp. NIES-64]